MSASYLEGEVTLHRLESECLNLGPYSLLATFDFSSVRLSPTKPITMSQACYQTPNVPVNATELAPCAGTAGTGTISLCCTPLGICLTNGLCATDDGPTSLFYSGGCTDSTYEADICPRFCTTPGDTYVVECAGPDSPVKDGDFCCSTNGDSDCCQNATNALGLAPSVSWAVAGVSPMSSATSAMSSQTTSASVRTLTLVPAHPATASPTSASNSSSGSTQQDSHRPLILGLGLGVGIPVLMFAIFLLWRRIKHTRNRDRTRQMSESMRGITASEAKPADPSELSEDQVVELASSQPTTVPIPSSTLHIGGRSAAPVELSADTEVPVSRGQGHTATETRIVPDVNPRRPQDGYLGAVTASQATGYLPKH